MQDKRGRVEADTLRDKWWVDGPWVKEVGVVTDFAKLHQDVDDTHEVPRGQGLLGAEKGTGNRKPVILWDFTVAKQCRVIWKLWSAYASAEHIGEHTLNWTQASWFSATSSNPPH